MNAARRDIVINGLVLSRGNDLHFEAVEIFFLGFIVAVVDLASEEFTDRNAAIAADGHRKGPGRRSVRSCNEHWC